MRRLLWPDCATHDHEAEMKLWLANQEHFPVFVSDQPDEELTGFLEASIHEEDPGDPTSTVAYIEGWYVEPAFRRKGIGKKLVHHTEEWARSRKFRAIMSGTEIDNALSILAHRQLGFVEVHRSGNEVIFKKQLQ
ncbi:MAG: GNAT family N-acetyltransferase [Bacteroidota bacterium]